MFLGEPVVLTGSRGRDAMTSGIRIRTSRAHAIACWTVLCLILALFSLGVPAAPASADMHHMPVELISSPVDGHCDCDDGHAGMPGHCHATPSCFAYAQAATTTVYLDLRSSSHPKVLSQDDVTSWSPQPNLQPPKHSIQA
jgi:hypothetical protein